MNKKSIRFTLYIIIAVIVCFISRNYIIKKAESDLQKIKNQTIFINQNSENELETGSINYPFHSINIAIEERKKYPSEEKWTLIISTGIYTENITVPENTTLFGDKENNKFINIVALEKGDNTLTLSDKVNLINLNISEGLNGVLIPFNTNTTIINTTISNAGKFNLKMESDENKEYNEEGVSKEVILIKTEEEIEQMPLVRLSHSVIKDSRSQGMYLKDGRIEISNSKIINNKEEGIDLHSHMYAKITDNEIIKNGESGIESEIEDNILFIENNKIDNNLKSGIALLTAEGVGEVYVKNNSISSNSKFGIRCAKHKSPPKKLRPFFSSVIKRENNVIKNNAEGALAPVCESF